MNNFLILSILFVLLICFYRKYYYNSNQCKLTPESKVFSKNLLGKITNDLTIIYPSLSDYKITFYPLECCDLEESLTDDKKKIYICLKNKHGDYYNYNKLLQVGIHEIAHAITRKQDPNHTSKEFIENYARLLQNANNLNLVNIKTL